MPAWTIRYRSIFGAPLEVEWLAGGWTSHLAIRTEPGGADHHLDFFGRPPRVKAWRSDPADADFADRDTVTRMKKTDRDKDWPIVGGLAAQSFARGDEQAVLHLQAVEPLRREREAELTALQWAFDTPDDLSAWPAELDGGCERP